jgi:hypothetical protein
MQKIANKYQFNPILTKRRYFMSGFKIEAKRWRQKTYGNTYHSVTITETTGTGKDYKAVEIARCPFTYGYGRQYEVTAFELLLKAKKLPRQIKDYTDFMRWERNNRDKISWFISDVDRKRDL